MRGDKPFVFTNCKTGEGIAALVDLIRENVLFDLTLPAPADRVKRASRTRVPRAAAPTRRTAPELAPYQDEPPQMRERRRGKTGFLRLGFERRGGRSILADLDCARPAPGAAGALLGRGMPELPVVFIITTSRRHPAGRPLPLDIAVGPGRAATSPPRRRPRSTRWTPTTPRRRRRIALGRRRLSRVPARPDHPLSRSRVSSATPASRSPRPRRCSTPRSCCRGASITIREASARPSRWRSRAAGRTAASCSSRSCVIEPARRAMRQTGVMGRFDVFGNALLLTPEGAGRRICAREADVDLGARLGFGASRLPNDAGLIYKVLGRETARSRPRCANSGASCARGHRSACRRRSYGGDRPQARRRNVNDGLASSREDGDEGTARRGGKRAAHVVGRSLRFVDLNLRGVGQVMFQDNSAQSGLLFFVAIGWGSYAAEACRRSPSAGSWRW